MEACHVDSTIPVKVHASCIIVDGLHVKVRRLQQANSAKREADCAEGEIGVVRI